jgi:hypothetical protein
LCVGRDMEQPPRKSVGQRILGVLLVFGALFLLGWMLGPFLVRGGPGSARRVRDNLRQSESGPVSNQAVQQTGASRSAQETNRMSEAAGSRR